MPYAGDLLIHDADAHVMETPDWLRDYADPPVRDRLQPLYTSTVAPGEDRFLDKVRARHQDPEYRSHDADEIMLRKNWAATGSFIKEDRPAALDLLGFASQLVFNTFANKALLAAEHGDDLEYAYGVARAHNRAIVDFCSVDRRLLPVGYVPLADFDTSAAFAEEAIDMGCKALMIASACPKGHSPSHVGLDRVWSQAQDAGLPIVFHVGGGGQLLDPSYFVNGLPPVPDFHGGDGNFRSVDYMAIPYPVMQTLSTMIIDGILDRFPRLKIGVIEQGASWMPGLMRSLDSAGDAFRKNEERLQKLELKPSEYILRQVRVTPYPHEDAGWVIEQTGEEVCMFSSDYPHVEGGRNPLGRFGRSLEKVGERARRRFYVDNFVDLMGDALAGV
ncbi:MAG TPA: amidohydrolase family protein [Acidimicrobiales bacterium]|nr:amidohydrolase family protein [Acidimicrobiales bacterium]